MDRGDSSRAGPWRPRGSWRGAVVLIAGALLAGAFPPLDWSAVAWVAVVPLLVAVGRCAPRRAFRLGFGFGFAFWFLALGWVRRLMQTAPCPAAVAFPAWPLVAAYCALYAGVFAALWAWVYGRVGRRGPGGALLATLAAPAIWIGLEYLRGSFGPYGLPWAAVGLSQHANLALLQTAQWTGVYGLSGLLVLTNAALAVAVLERNGTFAWDAATPQLDTPPPHPWPRARPQPLAQGERWLCHPELWLAAVAVAGAWAAGRAAYFAPRPPCALRITVAAIQPAIPQMGKWAEGSAEDNLDQLLRLTRLALRATPRPDLILWPETCTPGPTTQDGASRNAVMDVVSNGVPLLVGVVDERGMPGETPRLYNSAMLYAPVEGLVGVYDKQYLMPFGEFLPLESVFPFLARISPLPVSCVPGHAATVLQWGRLPPLGVMICSEDSVARLARAFFRGGARVLVNLTDDAWFDRTSGPAQHLVQSVFRAVETGLPVVRCTDSGITALIDPRGRVHEPTWNSARTAPEATVRLWRFGVPPTALPPTFYVRYGDAPLAIPCLVVTVALAFGAWRSTRRRKGSDDFTGRC